MTPVKNISIPNACHESWQQMTPVAQGRHCLQCCKTVTDFTLMSNDEIIAYLATARNVCGRFGQEQLNNLNNTLYAENLQSNRWRRWIMLIALLSQTAFYKAVAQTKHIKTEQRCKELGKAVRDTLTIKSTTTPVKVDTTFAFEPKVNDQFTSLQSVVGGLIVVRRQSFIKRTWHKIKRVF